MESTSLLLEVVPTVQSNEKVHRILNKEMTKKEDGFHKGHDMDQITKIKKH